MRISIVMPSFNQSSFVEAAIQSVLSQKYADFEVLFIDGGSTDGTMDIVDKYREQLAVVISEPDEGQSDALRKGFELASGEVLTWLNTDDLLLPGSLQDVATIFSENSGLNWVLGNVIWINQDDKILKCWKGEGYTPGWTRLGLLTAGGPSSFFRRELYQRVGGLNLNFDYMMDTELWWRFAVAGERFQRLRNYTWALRLHPAAKMSGHLFDSRSSEFACKVNEIKEAERRHILQLIDSYCIYRNPIISSVLNLTRRIVSPSYIQGRIDTFKWRKKDVQSTI